MDFSSYGTLFFRRRSVPNRFVVLADLSTDLLPPFGLLRPTYPESTRQMPPPIELGTPMASAPTKIAGLSNPGVIIQSKKPPRAGRAKPRNRPHSTVRFTLFRRPPSLCNKTVPMRATRKKRSTTRPWSELTLPVGRTITRTGPQVNRLQSLRLFKKLMAIVDTLPRYLTIEQFLEYRAILSETKCLKLFRPDFQKHLLASFTLVTVKGQ
jgi:hypothetical protein